MGTPNNEVPAAVVEEANADSNVVIEEKVAAVEPDNKNEAVAVVA